MSHKYGVFRFSASSLLKQTEWGELKSFSDESDQFPSLSTFEILWTPGEHSVVLRLFFSTVKGFLKDSRDCVQIFIWIENIDMKLSVSERIKDKEAYAARELQGKCVICCSEHSSTDRQIIKTGEQTGEHASAPLRKDVVG